jgi:hypothetical protein
MRSVSFCDSLARPFPFFCFFMLFPN